MDKTLLCAILFLNLCYAREISFNEIDHIIEGESITIKGYLSKREEGWVLLPIPGVKTCCPLPDKYLKLEGEFSENPYKVFTIEGKYYQGKLRPVRVD